MPFTPGLALPPLRSRPLQQEQPRVARLTLRRRFSNWRPQRRTVEVPWRLYLRRLRLHRLLPLHSLRLAVKQQLLQPQIVNRLLPLCPALHPRLPRLMRAVLTLVSLQLLQRLQPRIVSCLLPLYPPLHPRQPSCRPLRPRLLWAVLTQLLQLVGQLQEQEQEHGEAAGCGRQAAVAAA